MGQLKILKILKIIFWSLVYVVGLNWFLIPAGLFTVGLTGIAQLIVGAFSLPVIGFGLVYLLINIPGILLGWFKIGKKFTLYTFISIVSVSIFAKVVPVVHVTDEVLLNCIFSGILMGFAVGGILRLSASTGGVDFYSIYYMLKKKGSFQFFNFMINFVIILILAFSYDLETVLFAIINLYVITVSIGFIFTTHEKLTMLIIVKKGDGDLVCKKISENMLRGATIINGSGSYSGDEKEMIYLVVSKHEVTRIKEISREVDEHAFINILETVNVDGNFFEKYDF